MQEKIRNFTDLIAWQEAHKLALEVYKLTKSFPQDERFGLITQIQRSAVSVTSNIAEGFGRRTGKDKTHFYDTAIGSLFELQNQVILSRDLGYIVTNVYHDLYDNTIQVNRLLNGLIKSVM